MARALFAEATALSEQGRYETAAAKLREAIAIKETPGLRFHLAHAEEKQGHLVEARVEYDRARELLQQGADAPDVAALLEPARAALQRRIPTVRIRWPAESRGSALAIDGRTVAAQLHRRPIPLNPGAHVVSITAPGYAPFELRLQLTEGEDRVLEPTLTPSRHARANEPSSGPDTTFEPDRGSGIGLLEIVLLSEGMVVLAGLTVGTVYIVEERRLNGEISTADETIEGFAQTLQSDREKQSVCERPLAPQLPDTVASACRTLDSTLVERDRARLFYKAGFITAGAGGLLMLGTWLIWPSGGSTARASIKPIRGGVLSSWRVTF